MKDFTECHCFSHEEISFGAYCIYKAEQKRNEYTGAENHWFQSIKLLKKLRSKQTVVGYHACPIDFACSLWSGEFSIEQWKESDNPYEWLGNGIYFWENGIRRAREWAEQKENENGREYAVLKCNIELGRCLDITNTGLRDWIKETYDSLQILHKEEPDLGVMPINKGGDQDKKLRNLDCYVINQFLDLCSNGIENETGEVEEIEFQTVRYLFEEGDPIFPGSAIKEQTHTQLTVRDRSCILSISPENYRNR